MGAGRPKAFLSLAGRPLLLRAAEAFEIVLDRQIARGILQRLQLGGRESLREPEVAGTKSAMCRW